MAAIVSRARWAFLLLLPAADKISTPEARARERHRRAAMTAIAAAFAKFVSVGTALISIPLTLHYLGAERYGMWMVMSSLVAVLSFADLGLGNGVLNAVASAYGRDDRLAIQAYVSSGFFALILVAGVIVALFVFAYPFVPWYRLFNVESPLARLESGPALAVFVACFALAVPIGIVQRVQMGLQQGFMASLWQGGGSLLGLVGIIAAIHLEAGLPWLVLAFAGAPLTAGLLNSLFFFGRLRPDIAPRWRTVSRDAITQIARTGLLFFVLQVVVAVAYASDNLIIAQIIGAPAVAQYAVPERMFSLVTMILAMALSPLWPAYGEANSRGDSTWVRRTLKHSLIVSMCTATVLATILVLAGPRLIQLWVGHTINPPFMLLAAFGIWKVIEAGGNATAMFLNGINAMRVQIILAVVMAVSAFSLKLFLIPRVGIAGAVWATVIAYIICMALPLAVYIPRVIRSTK